MHIAYKAHKRHSNTKAVSDLNDFNNIDVFVVVHADAGVNIDYNGAHIDMKQ